MSPLSFESHRRAYRGNEMSKILVVEAFVLDVICPGWNRFNVTAKNVVGTSPHPAHTRSGGHGIKKCSTHLYKDRTFPQ